jgi:hypothetical protein
MSARPSRPPCGHAEQYRKRSRVAIRQFHMAIDVGARNHFAELAVYYERAALRWS